MTGDYLLEQGVKNLKEFGYPEVTKENIITDPIYSAFFKSMLKESLGHGLDESINKVLADIESTQMVTEEQAYGTDCRGGQCT